VEKGVSGEGIGKYTRKKQMLQAIQGEKTTSKQERERREVVVRRKN